MDTAKPQPPEKSPSAASGSAGQPPASRAVSKSSGRSSVAPPDLAAEITPPHRAASRGPGQGPTQPPGVPARPWWLSATTPPAVPEMPWWMRTAPSGANVPPVVPARPAWLDQPQMSSGHTMVPAGLPPPGQPSAYWIQRAPLTAQASHPGGLPAPPIPRAASVPPGAMSVATRHSNIGRGVQRLQPNPALAYSAREAVDNLHQQAADVGTPDAVATARRFKEVFLTHAPRAERQRALAQLLQYLQRSPANDAAIRAIQQAEAQPSREESLATNRRTGRTGL
jgi:hypothetical protein